MSQIHNTNINIENKELRLKSETSDSLSNNTDQKNAPTDTPSTENKQTETPVLINTKNLMIICGPNGVNFEIYSHTVIILFTK